ncbi:MAG: hypothetical protein V1663_03715 [archaeon]
MFFFKKKNKSSIPKELPSFAIDLLEEKENKENVKKETLNTPVNSNVISTNKTYFSDLLKTIAKETELLETDEEYYKKRISLYGEDILTKDLIVNMKENWKKQRSNIIFTYEEKKLKDDILSKITKLQSMEEEWQTYHLRLIEKEENIKKDEEELKTVLRKFRDLCSRHIDEKNKSKMYENIKPEHYFYLNNGNIIKNLFELNNTLKTVDEETFKHHVTENRNDFSIWVRDVLKDDRLANSISKATTREDMIRILSQLY